MRFSSAGQFAALDCRAQAERAPRREGSWDCCRAVGHSQSLFLAAEMLNGTG